MRKLAFLAVLVVMCLGLTSCTVYNAWVIKGDGRGIKGTYKLVGGQAENVDGVFAREIFFSTYKVNKELLDSLPGVKVTVDNDNKTKSVEIGKVTTK